MENRRTFVAETQEQITADTVLISGPPRSGTTILGRLISSLKGIEYHFEPPLVWTIYSLVSMGVLSEDAAKTLLKVYLSEDLLLESAHGRRANLRPGDDSLILKSMAWTELVRRWNQIRNRSDALKYIKENRLRLAMKLPSMIDAIPMFQETFPGSQFIVIVRDGREMVKSVLQKGWLTDEGLAENYWPYKEVNGARITHLVEDAIAPGWAQMNAATRACYLWRRDAQYALDAQASESLRGRLLTVKYEQLLADASGVMHRIAEFLSTEVTDLTQLGIMSVRPPSSLKDSREYSFLNGVEESELRQFEAMNARWGYQ